MSAAMDAVTVDYPEPVARLLTLGRPGPGKPPDYAADFGISRDDAGELIRLATDPVLNTLDEEIPAIWGPVHAWQALGQFRVEEAIEPLIGLMSTSEDDDAVMTGVPRVLGMIGPASLPALEAFIAESPSDTYRASAAIEGIPHIAEHHPEQRDACVAVLNRILERHAEQGVETNAWLISSLLDLKALGSIDLIRAAFDADRVDISIVGDIEDVELTLGLRTARATPKPRYNTFDDVMERIFAAAKTRPPQATREPEPRWESATVREKPKAGRNDPCTCGSGRKYKKCCAA